MAKMSDEAEVLLQRGRELSNLIEQQEYNELGDLKQPPARIWDAISETNIDKLLALFSRYPDEIDGYTFFGGGTYLHYAAAHSSVEIVDVMIKLGFDLNKRGNLRDEVALDAACGNGNVDVVRYLFDHGSHIDIAHIAHNPLFSCVSGYQPHWEVPRERFFECAKILVNAGIDLSVSYTDQNLKDMTPLAWATMWGREDIVDLIADKLFVSNAVARSKGLEQATRTAHLNTST
jgi:uncharacterized protein